MDNYEDTRRVSYATKRDGTAVCVILLKAAVFCVVFYLSAKFAEIWIGC